MIGFSLGELATFLGFLIMILVVIRLTISIVKSVKRKE